MTKTSWRKKGVYRRIDAAYQAVGILAVREAALWAISDCPKQDEPTMRKVAQGEFDEIPNLSEKARRSLISRSREREDGILETAGKRVIEFVDDQLKPTDKRDDVKMPRNVSFVHKFPDATDPVKVLAALDEVFDVGELT